jgi:hypothetical protein
MLVGGTVGEGGIWVGVLGRVVGVRVGVMEEDPVGVGEPQPDTPDSPIIANPSGFPLQKGGVGVGVGVDP